MLTIRMQRTGRKGLAQFRVVVQDSRFSPSSGRIVAQLGHYNPHTKDSVIDTETAEKYLSTGAQPSPRVARLLQDQKVKLPEWVDTEKLEKKRATRNPEKLRKNQPKEANDESVKSGSDSETSTTEKMATTDESQESGDKSQDAATEETQAETVEATEEKAPDTTEATQSTEEPVAEAEEKPAEA